jgi:hypothetical protein
MTMTRDAPITFADALELLLEDFDPIDFMLNSFRAEHGREPRSDDEFLRFSEAALAKMADALAQVEEAISRCTRH